MKLFQIQKKRLLEIIKSEKFRYLSVGALNTVVGYLIGVACYEALYKWLGIWGVGIIGNVVAITFSFITYKTLVFKTAGGWFVEYLRCYLVYGAMAILGIILLWLFVKKIEMSIWLAQGAIIFCTTILSYVGHKYFTFVTKNKKHDCQEKD